MTKLLLSTSRYFPNSLLQLCNDTVTWDTTLLKIQPSRSTYNECFILFLPDSQMCWRLFWVHNIQKRFYFLIPQMLWKLSLTSEWVLMRTTNIYHHDKPTYITISQVPLPYLPCSSHDVKNITMLTVQLWIWLKSVLHSLWLTLRVEA